MFCLKVPSDPAWAESARESMATILVDHAHCELKAASNAMALAGRHPHDLKVVRALTALAQEELEHFDRVVALLEQKGLALGPPPVDEYAAELRAALGRLPPSPFGRVAGLVDRLLCASLIEARSCERFKLLLETLDRERDPELHAFYEELFAAEARHYTTFVDLAVHAAEAAEAPADCRASIVARLDALSRLEGDIVARLAKSDRRATVHG